MAMELVKYDMDAVAIQGLKEKYLDIVILPDDKASYAMVMAGQKECRDIRKTVDEWHKENKADIIKAGKHYDSEKNRVYDALDPIESHLKAVRKAEDDRIAKIEAERIARIQARIAFITKTAAVGYNDSSEVIQGKINAIAEFIIDDTLEEFQLEAKNSKDYALNILNDAIIQRKKFEKEEADRAAERARLEQVAKDQEAERQRQAEAQKIIDEQNARLKAESDKLEQAKKDEATRARKEKLQTRKEQLDPDPDGKFPTEEELLEKSEDDFIKFADDWNLTVAKIKTDREAAIKAQAEKDLLAKIERENKAQAEKERLAAAEAARVAALAPDREKVKVYVQEIIEALNKRPVIKFDDLNIQVGSFYRAVLQQTTKLLKIAGDK